MSRPPAFAALALLCAVAASAQVVREDAKPKAVPPVEGRAVGPSVRGPVEPEPTLEPALLAAPVAVDKALFDKLVTHVRKHCSSDEDSGLCCLSGQSPLKKGAPNRTACLDVEVPQEEGDVHHAVYREVFVGLTLHTTASRPEERRVDLVTLEAAMDGTVTQVEMSSEGSDGVQHRADPMRPGETEPLFTEAAKDLLVITPRVRI